MGCSLIRYREVSTNFALLFRENTTLGSLKSTVEKPKKKSSPLVFTLATPSATPSPPSVVVPLINKKEPKPSNIRKSYTQVSKLNVSSNIKNVL